MLVLVLSVLAFLTISLTSASYMIQLSISRGSSIKTKASSTGESITNLALIDFQLDPTFGTPAHPDYSKVYRWTAPNGSIGTLVFDPAQAAALDIPYSTNNFDGTAVVVGASGFDVPPGSVELIGRGEYGDTVELVRHLVYVPSFAYVVATNGSFESNGSLLVGELPEGSNPATINLDDLLPGHLGAGSNIALNGRADVVGNVQAGGTISRSGSINIRGEVYENHPLPLLPVIDLEEYRTETAFTTVLPESSEASLTLDEHTLVNGSLNVDGSLKLNSVILFVDGDLTVGGGASGVGAIVCKGKVTFNSAASFSANEKVAILAAGDVTLQGSGASSLFRGMVYTEGKFLADTITVIGCFVSNSPSGAEASPGKIELNDVKLLQKEVDFAMTNPWERNHCCNNPITGGLSQDDGASLQMDMRLVEKNPDRYEIRVREYTDENWQTWNPVCSDIITTMPLPGAVANQIKQAHPDGGLAAPHCRGGCNSTVENTVSVLASRIDASETSDPPKHLNFDFNQFLNMRDRVRTLYLGAL
jgi:cytoskeletal protein CcmA (bactofilin family)